MLPVPTGGGRRWGVKIKFVKIQQVQMPGLEEVRVQQRNYSGLALDTLLIGTGQKEEGRSAE